MFRAARASRLSPMVHQAKDGKETHLSIKKEIGMWLYKKESLAAFQQYCASQNVRARGKVKIVSSDTHCRCLRTTRRVYPGEAIITAPAKASLNFLTCAKEMATTQHDFPVQLDWKNWNFRLRYLQGAATHEMLLAGWLTRAACREGTSPIEPFAKWLLEDTTGRDGITSGIGRERGDDNVQLDKLLQDMAYDAGEEVQEHSELLFRAIAAIMKRTFPADIRMIRKQLPGTPLDRSVVDVDALFVPTTVPLFDCVPHEETGKHNTMVDYHETDELTNETVRAELGLTDRDTSAAVIGSDGLISLRAIEFIEEGAYLQMRGWPKTEMVDQEYAQQTIMEQSIARNNHKAS